MTNRPRFSELQEKLKKQLIEFQKTILLQDEKIQSQQLGQEKQETALFLEIMDVLDVFDVLFAQVKPEEIKRIQNFKAVQRKLARILSSRNVEKIELSDQSAQPELCKVVETQVRPEFSAGQVIDVLKPGYRTSSKVLRPAEVITAQ